MSQPITGMQRYSQELIHAMDQLLANGTLNNAEVRFEILAPPGARKTLELRHIPIRFVGHCTGHQWEQLELPMYCRGNLLFTPSGGAPVIHDWHVMTIPDAAVFAAATAYSWRYAAWYRWLFRRLATKARRILTISEFSKQEIQKWCAVNPERITVTYLGYEHILRVCPDNSIIAKHGLASQPFVLAVSSMNPNKNFQAIADAVHLLRSHNIKFAIAGGMNSDVFGKAAALPDNVVQLGYVTDAELRALYQRALCFVFPSFYEGFGLPPLEAMACGCPVIVSKAASLPEVCGDSALYCDPPDSHDIARQIVRIAESPEFRAGLIEQGRKRVVPFKWEQTARETLEVLSNVVNQRSMPLDAKIPSTT